MVLESQSGQVHINGQSSVQGQSSAQGQSSVQHLIFQEQSSVQGVDLISLIELPTGS